MLHTSNNRRSQHIDKRRRPEQRSQPSVIGGYQLSIRWHFAHIGTAAILLQHDRAGGHWVVPRWERLLANSVLLQSKHFYETKHSRIWTAPQFIEFQCMKSDGERAFFSYEITSVRGDGTNTRAGEAKAHTCEIQTLFRHLPVGDPEEVRFNEANGGTSWVTSTNLSEGLKHEQHISSSAGMLGSSLGSTSPSG